MIEMSTILAMIILFIHACTWDEGIFDFVRNWISEDTKLSKPIYSCPICMSPWWGTLFMWLLFGIDSWREWLAVIGCTGGIGVLSVIAIYIKDYCKSRTRTEDECC